MMCVYMKDVYIICVWTMYVKQKVCVFEYFIHFIRPYQM